MIKNKTCIYRFKLYWDETAINIFLAFRVRTWYGSDYKLRAKIFKDWQFLYFVHLAFLPSISWDAPGFQVGLNIHEHHPFLFFFADLSLFFLFSPSVVVNIMRSTLSAKRFQTSHTHSKTALSMHPSELLTIYASRLFW